MPISKCRKLLHFIFYCILCVAELAVMGATILIIVLFVRYITFSPTQVFGPLILIIVLNLISIYGYWKGFVGILKSQSNYLLIFSVFLILNAIFDVIIAFWGLIIRDGIPGDLKEIMSESFINYTKLHYKKEHWDTFQQDLKCCGINGPQSYVTANTQFLPISCCNAAGNISFCESGIFYKDGCLDIFTNLAQEYLYCFISFVLLFVIIQIIGIAIFCNLNSFLNKTSNFRISTLPERTPLRKQ